MLNLNLYNDHGQTALHVADTHGHTDIAEVLIMAGAQKLPMLLCIKVDCNNECRVAHNCEETHG